jgi:hypothetical protein
VNLPTNEKSLERDIHLLKV